VTWGTPGAEADNKIAVTLQLKNPLGDDLAAKERIRLTCTEGAAMNLASATSRTESRNRLEIPPFISLLQEI
jgi:hypothetical protein